MKAAFYRLTLQDEKLAVQIVTDKEAIFEEGQTRLDNLRAGKKANDHHSRIKQAFTELVDGEAAPTANNILFVAGAGLFITSAVVAAPPVGIAAATVAGAGFAVDRLSGAHDAREGLRDVERYLEVLNTLKDKMVEKSASESDPMMMRIETEREKLFEKYSERFCEKEKVSLDEFKRGEASSTSLDKTPGGISAITTTNLGLSITKFFEGASVGADVATSALSFGAAKIATGGIKRAAKAIGRPEWKTQIDNVQHATAILDLVQEAEDRHGITLTDKKSVSSLAKINKQAEAPQEYIEAWEKTDTSLKETTDRKKTVDELVAGLRQERDDLGLVTSREMTSEKSLELKEALMDFCELGEEYKDPKILGTDRVNPLERNPIKGLAKCFEKLSELDPTAPGELKIIEEILKKMDGQIEKATERNDKLVGDRWIAENYPGTVVVGVVESNDVAKRPVTNIRTIHVKSAQETIFEEETAPAAMPTEEKSASAPSPRAISTEEIVVEIVTGSAKVAPAPEASVDMGAERKETKTSDPVQAVDAIFGGLFERVDSPSAAISSAVAAQPRISSFIGREADAVAEARVKQSSVQPLPGTAAER